MSTDMKQQQSKWTPVRLWRMLIEPAASIERPEERRRIRLLSALLLITVISSIWGAFASESSITLLLSAVGAIIAYGLSRTRFYRVSIWLVVIALLLPTYIALIDTDSSTMEYVLTASIWALLPLILASFWVSPWATIGLTVVTSLSMIGMRFFVPDISASGTYIMFALILISGGLLSVSSFIRQADLKQIDQQTEQLKHQNEELVTSNKELRIARRQAEEASRVKSEFLATMSHELRTPLNAIIGFTEIMISGMGGIELTDRTRHMTERIHANSKDLLELINDVLDLAKIEAQRLEMVHKPYSPSNLMETIHGEMMSLAEQKQLEFALDISPDTPDEVVGDQFQVRRVIINLLSNAIKFTDTGEVRLATTSDLNGQWMITVNDTGIGIPPHALDYIFDPFRQVDGTYTRAYGGTGLGLAITHELVRAMGGTIKVESALGRGSTFVVTLPRINESNGAKPAEEK